MQLNTALKYMTGLPLFIFLNQALPNSKQAEKRGQRNVWRSLYCEIILRDGTKLVFRNWNSEYKEKKTTLYIFISMYTGDNIYEKTISKIRLTNSDMSRESVKFTVRWDKFSGISVVGWSVSILHFSSLFHVNFSFPPTRIRYSSFSLSTTFLSFMEFPLSMWKTASSQGPERCG